MSRVSVSPESIHLVHGGLEDYGSDVERAASSIGAAVQDAFAEVEACLREQQEHVEDLERELDAALEAYRQAQLDEATARETIKQDEDGNLTGDFAGLRRAQWDQKTHREEAHRLELVLQAERQRLRRMEASALPLRADLAALEESASAYGDRCLAQVDVMAGELAALEAAAQEYLDTDL